MAKITASSASFIVGVRLGQEYSSDKAIGVPLNCILAGSNYESETLHFSESINRRVKFQPGSTDYFLFTDNLRSVYGPIDTIRVICKSASGEQRYNLQYIVVYDVRTSLLYKFPSNTHPVGDDIDGNKVLILPIADVTPKFVAPNILEQMCTRVLPLQSPVYTGGKHQNAQQNHAGQWFPSPNSLQPPGPPYPQHQQSVPYQQQPQLPGPPQQLPDPRYPSGPRPPSPRGYPRPTSWRHQGQFRGRSHRHRQPYGGFMNPNFYGYPGQAGYGGYPANMGNNFTGYGYPGVYPMGQMPMGYGSLGYGAYAQMGYGGHGGYGAPMPGYAGPMAQGPHAAYGGQPMLMAPMMMARGSWSWSWS